MNDLYENDYDLWIEKQKQILLSKDFDSLDIENLIEELDDMGDKSVSKLTSFLKVMITHLLKYEYQKVVLKSPWVEDRVLHLWRNSIIGPRSDIEDILEKNPNLKNKIDTCLEEGYRKGKKLAIEEMNDYIKEKHKKLNNKSFPDICPWSFDQIMDSNWVLENIYGEENE